jgi:hypothetical protein
MGGDKMAIDFEMKHVHNPKEWVPHKIRSGHEYPVLPEPEKHELRETIEILLNSDDTRYVKFHNKCYYIKDKNNFSMVYDPDINEWVVCKTPAPHPHHKPYDAENECPDIPKEETIEIREGSQWVKIGGRWYKIG